MKRRVLIVDDEADIREVAQLSLEMTAGWEVLTAPSGREALALVEAVRPDAVLLDVMMPGMDGPTTLRHLQERGSDVPVVLLTAKVQSADQRQFASLGVAGVLAKPFDPMTLADEVAALLGWSL